MEINKGMSFAILAAASILLTAACSSGDTATTSDEQTAEAADTEQVLNNYFTGFATNDIDDMEAMLKNSAPGSPAFLYGRNQIATQRAAESANQSFPASTATVSGDTVTLIEDLPAEATEAERQEATTTFQDFAFASDGKLETWTSDPGGPLAPRIKAQSGRGSSGGVTIKATTSYVNNGGNLAVTYSVRNKAKSKAQVTPDGYINPDRRQVDIATFTGSLDVAPGAFADERASIENGKTGGKMLFSVYITGSTVPPTTITVPVAK